MTHWDGKWNDDSLVISAYLRIGRYIEINWNKLKSHKTLAGTEGTDLTQIDLTQIDNNNTARPPLR